MPSSRRKVCEEGTLPKILVDMRDFHSAYPFHDNLLLDEDVDVRVLQVRNTAYVTEYVESG